MTTAAGATGRRAPAPLGARGLAASSLDRRARAKGRQRVGNRHGAELPIVGPHGIADDFRGLAIVFRKLLGKAQQLKRAFRRAAQHVDLIADQHPFVFCDLPLAAWRKRQFQLPLEFQYMLAYFST